MEVQLREYWYSLVEVLIVVVEVVINGISTGRISKSPILTTKKKLISWWTTVQLHPATLLYTKTDKVIWNSNSNPLPNCGWTVWLTKVQKWKYLWKVFLDSWRVILQAALYISLDESRVVETSPDFILVCYNSEQKDVTKCEISCGLIDRILYKIVLDHFCNQRHWSGLAA